MSDKKDFEKFFRQFGVNTKGVTPEEVVLEMENQVDWKSAISVGQVWFLFGADDEFLGLLNDETMEFESRNMA